MQIKPDKLLYSVDLGGTLLFGIEGATAAIAGDLDLLGLLVLAFATALRGGIIRDVLIGAVPPSALRDWRYPTTAFGGAAIVFFFHRFVQGIPAPVILILDAAGLALFAIAGTEKALLHNMSPLIAALLGTITAVGGGTIRDILLARIPASFGPMFMRRPRWPDQPLCFCAEDCGSSNAFGISRRLVLLPVANCQRLAPLEPSQACELLSEGLMFTALLASTEARSRSPKRN